MKKAQNHALLTSWVNTYADEMYSLAMYKVSSKEVAEDLVQETFVSATQAIKSCKTVRHPKTWLFTILNNKIIDFYRKKTSRFNQSFSSYENSCFQVTESLFDEQGKWKNGESKFLPEEAENLLDNPEFNKIWSNCLESLPKNWKFVILSKFLLNKKGEEVCKELNITPSNYWQMIHRAKLMLRMCINKHWEI